MTRQQKRHQVRMLAKKIKELQKSGALPYPTPRKTVLQRVSEFLKGKAD